MIKVELIRGRNSKTKKVVVSLFADKREDLISGQEIYGMPDGYSIDFGSSCKTANGEKAYLKSDCATWVWVKVDPTTITLEELDITENGEYTAESGKAYTPVIVQIPLGNKTVSANGTYTATDDNLQGYSEVTVEVPDPELITKSITVNGTYSAEDDKVDGYNQVEVSVPESKIDSRQDPITSNGTYKASENSLDGYSEVNVSVQPNVSTKSINTNGIYNASSDNLDGYSQVSVTVPQNTVGNKPDSITENGTYYASGDNLDGYSQVTVDVPTPNLQVLTVDSAYNRTYSPEGGYDGFSQVDVSIDKLTLDADHNGEYTPAQSADVWTKVNVNVQPNVTTLTATENKTTYSASSEGYDGYSEVTVNVSTTANLTSYSFSSDDFTKGEHTIYPEEGYDGFSEISYSYLSLEDQEIYSNQNFSTIGSGWLVTSVNINVCHTIKFTTSEPPTNVSFENEEDTAHLKILVPSGSIDAYRNAENFPDDAEYEEY